MEARSLDGYVNLGSVFQGLCEATITWNATNGAGSALHYLDKFLRNIDDLQLNVTSRMRTTGDLRKFREALSKRPKDVSLTKDEASKLSKMANSLWEALFAELKGKRAFIVSDLRMDAQKLLTNPSALMATDVFDSLPESAREDFAEAGKCIAFALPTAAAFHLLRGTEGGLRTYYCSVVKQKRVNPMLWGSMVTHLRKRSKPPPAVLLDTLDSIRVNYRNPTAHPEKTYDIDEAQDLWAVAVDVVNRMLKAS